MTGKERWLRILDGKEADRLMFWPKIINPAYRKAQPAPFCDMSLMELYDYVGCDRLVYLRPCVRVIQENVTYEEEIREGKRHRIFRTPVGELESIDGRDEESASWHTLKYMVSNEEEMSILKYVFEHTKVEYDPEVGALNKEMYEELGDRGVAISNVGESPLMDFLEWQAGIEEGHYLYYDCPEMMEELFEQMQRVNCDRLKIMCEHSIADVLLFTENTSTTVLSPQQFMEYCHGYLLEYKQIADQYGRRLIYHMCGHLQKILPLLQDIPHAGIEALTSPPMGNTTFAEARKYLPDYILIGGSNALTWLKSVEEIEEELNAYLEPLEDYHGIVVGTGGLIPHACHPDTLKEITKYLYSLPMKKQ